MQNMDAGFIGIICSSYNTDVTTMVSDYNNSNIEMFTIGHKLICILNFLIDHCVYLTLIFNN